MMSKIERDEVEDVSAENVIAPHDLKAKVLDLQTLEEVAGAEIPTSATNLSRAMGLC
jgi:hypothetical protein